MCPALCESETIHCHLILKTHRKAGGPRLHRSKLNDSGNCLSQALALPTARPALSLPLLLHSPWTQTQLLPPTKPLAKPLTEPAPPVLTTQSPFAQESCLLIDHRGPLASFISRANFLLGPLPGTSGPSSFPPRVRPLGTANGSAPAHWDPHSNCSRAPHGVAVGSSRAPTHAPSARAPRRWEGRE